MATAAPARSVVALPRSPVEYWHLLSLDAPSIAVLWSWALCHAAHLELSGPAALFIVMGVWVSYVLDRLVDGFGAREPHWLRERHYFHARHRAAFCAVVLAVSCGLALLSVYYLPRTMLREFSLVFAAVLSYFALVHCGRPGVRRWLPKELAVGVLFAVGVAVPAWSQLAAGRSLGEPKSLAIAVWPRVELAPVVALFAALCWLNCLAIESWELDEVATRPSLRVERRPGEADHVSQNLNVVIPTSMQRSACLSVRGIALVLALASMLVFASLHVFASTAVRREEPLCLCILTSAAILLALDRVRGCRLSSMQLRIAADAALLTPLLLLAFSGQ